MRFKRRIGILTYIFFDYVTAMFVWAGFFFYRKFYIEDYPINIKQQILNDPNFFIGIFGIPFIWLVLYFVAGTYTDIYRKSRLAEIT